MKNINTRPEHAAASATLAQLTAALQAARAEEGRLLAAMAQTPGKSDSPLDAALALLAGQAPQRTDNTGLNQALEAVRVTIATLTPGLEQQRAVLKGLVDELSAQACADAAVTHAKAAQGIADALVTLSKAQANEAAVRASIETAGYDCGLPALVTPAIDFHDEQSQLSRYMRECQSYATDTQDAASGALDKPATVRLLTPGQHGEHNDVLTLPGRLARMLQRMGHAEASSDKPRKAPSRAAAQPAAWGLEA